MRFTVKGKWTVFITVAVLGFGFDWMTKHIASTALPYGKPVPIIGEFLQWLLVYNKAAIFGLDPRHVAPWFPLNQFFMVFSIIAAVVLVLYYRSLKSNEVFMHWGIALVMPGALGNLWDRVLYPGQGVVDFIRLGISERIYWPIFNMADVYVTFGVAFILLSFLQEELRRKASAGKQPSASASPHASGTPP
jgi:signal peptidase II